MESWDEVLLQQTKLRLLGTLEVVVAVVEPHEEPFSGS